MKKIKFCFYLTAVVIALVFINNCKKDSSVSVPIVTCDSITGVFIISANVYGNVSVDGGATVTARGVCWNKTGNPTIANDTIGKGNGTGIFKTYISGLSARTKYYVKAYATNSAGTAYSQVDSFTTKNLVISPLP